MPLPESIKNKPEIRSGLELYWKAFSDLSSDRDIGMGVGPIPWCAIDKWGLRHRILGDDFERLVLVVRGLDTVYIEKQASRRKSKMGKGKGSFSKTRSMRST